MGRIGFIGAGNMALAIAGGLIGNSSFQDKYPQFAVTISDKSKDQLTHWSAKYSNITIATSNIDLATNVDILFLSVKPQQLDDVLAEICSVVGEKLVISIAAGVSIAKLRNSLPLARISRIMPNTPCLVAEGMSALCYSENALESDKELVCDIFSAIGQAIEIEESLINAVTGLSGSGPAFVYEVAQAFIDGGLASGLPEPVARKLTAQTLIGAGRMLLERNESPAELVRMVASPGGTTEAGLKVLADDEWKKCLRQAVIAAKLRADELGK